MKKKEQKSSDDGRDVFSGVAWKWSGTQQSEWGWEVHSTSQERWMKTFWRVILSLSVMEPRGVAHSQISDILRGCRFVIVSGSRRVLSLWMFYMQVSVSWTWCELRAATGSQCREIKRGVTWPLLGSLKTSRAAAFWIICKGLIVHDESLARRALQ